MASGHAAAMPAGDRRLIGMMLVAMAAVLFSTGGLIVRSLEYPDPWTILFWRSLSAMAFLLGFMLIRDGLRGTADLFRRMGWPGLLVGFFLAASSISFLVALSLTTVARTLVMLSAGPLVAAVLARVVLGEPIRPRTWATIAAVVAGITIMVWAELGGEGSLLGDFFAFLIAVCYATAIVITRRYPTIRMMPAAFTGTVFGFVASLPFAAPLAIGLHDFALLMVFGSCQLGVGLALFVTGARLIPAAVSGLLSMVEPILGPIWVWLAFSERPATTTLVGGAIVIVSVAVNTLLDARYAASRAAMDKVPIP